LQHVAALCSSQVLLDTVAAILSSPAR
jgi:hypothetical protein